MYKRILVPLDGSDLAEAVLPYAQSLAQCLGSEIVLLRVTVNPVVEFSFADPAIAASTIREIERDAKNYIESKCSELEAAGMRVSFLIREGPVADTILAVAEAMQVEIIAMSTHGRSGIRRWLLGSVTERVVHHSSIPVMVIRPQQSSQSSDNQSDHAIGNRDELLLAEKEKD